MDSVLGGGVIFVIAAVLWAAVLVPAWVRRREFHAAEKNALRLQRTLRVLAETAEVPTEVRLEATARHALAQEKLLRTAQKRQEAERNAALAEARAEQLRAEIHAQEMQRKQAAVVRAARLRRPAVRRMRSFASLVTLLGALSVFVGIGFAVSNNGVTVLTWSSAAFAAGLGALVLLAPGRAQRAAAPHASARASIERSEHSPTAAQLPSFDTATGETAEVESAHHDAQRAAAAHLEQARRTARVREHERLRAARAAQRINQTDSILLRDAKAQLHHEQAPAALPSPAQRVSQQRQALQQQQRDAARARLRSMGVVGDTAEGMPDLDAALRRRRNAS